jgi:sterol desaturase/sphingolipid hydroxylase (fatty acid hydroxylase superfamily)
MGWTQIFIALVPSILVTLVLMSAERLRGKSQGDSWRNLQSWALQFGAAITLLTYFTLPLRWSLISGSNLPLWAGLVIFVITRDFGEYIFHRAQHRIPFLWAMHSLHHSDPNMQALTTQRHFWGDQLVKSLTIWPATFLVISPTSPILMLFGVIVLWNFVVHSGLQIDFGRWSWILNNPAYHRRHHSVHPNHFNSNFAALFPIFDVICGSYNRPDGFPETGLAQKPENLAEIIVWPLIWDNPNYLRALFGKWKGKQRLIWRLGKQ